MGNAKALGERCLGFVLDHFSDYLAAYLAAQDTDRPYQCTLAVPAIGCLKEWAVDLHKINVEPSHVVICGGTCTEIIKAYGVSGAPKPREKFFGLGKIVHCGRLSQFE